MPIGRPTDYTPELIAKCYEYIDGYEALGDKIPSHVGLANYIGISRSYLYTWAKDEGKEEFSNILDTIMVKQEQKLINNGLDGTFNANITKLVLGKHGYHDKQDTNIKADVNMSDMSAEELDSKIRHFESLVEQSETD